MLAASGITKGAHALDLLQQLRIQGQGLEEGTLQLPVLKMRRKGHVLKGEHKEIASLIAHGQAATTVRKAGNEMEILSPVEAE